MSTKNLQKERLKSPLSVTLPEGQVRIFESHHAVDFEMKLSSWDFHKLCWVAVGKGALESSTGSNLIHSNNFLLMPARWTHRFVDDPKSPLTLVVLCVSEKFLAESGRGQLQELWNSILRKASPGQPLKARTAFHQTSLVECYRLALQEQENQRPGWEVALASVTTRLILSLARNYCEPSNLSTQSSARSIEGAIEYIDENLYQRLTIESMARKSSISPRRFTTLFKQKTGKTFSDYLNQQRIGYARKRLHETGHILYACHSSGFNDLAYFYRVFKKLTGTTPGRYLRK